MNRLTILLSLLCTLACGQDHSSNRIANFQAQGFTLGGWCTICPQQRPNFFIEMYSKQRLIKLLFLTEISKPSAKQLSKKIVDSLDISIAENELIVIGGDGITIEGQTDDEIICLVNTDILDPAKIIKAWRANRITKKIEPISIKNIKCTIGVEGT